MAQNIACIPARAHSTLNCQSQALFLIHLHEKSISSRPKEIAPIKRWEKLKITQQRQVRTAQTQETRAARTGFPTHLQPAADLCPHHGRVWAPAPGIVGSTVTQRTSRRKQGPGKQVLSFLIWLAFASLTNQQVGEGKAQLHSRGCQDCPARWLSDGEDRCFLYLDIINICFVTQPDP